MFKRSILLWGPFLAICVIGLIIMMTLDAQTGRNSATPNQTSTTIISGAESTTETTTATEDTTDTTQEDAENTEDVVTDSIAEITSSEILEGEPPTEDATSAGGSVDLGLQLQNALNETTTALSSIRNQNTARDALPVLESAAQSLSSTATLAQFLPTESQEALSNFANSNIESVQEAITTVNKNGRVKRIIEPSTNTIIEALTKISQ